MAKSMLLLSSSRVGDSAYLATAAETISAFLQDARQIAFIGYAGITISPVQYLAMVTEALPQISASWVNIALSEHPLDALAQCDAVVVGGGNTFNLLKQLQQTGLLAAIRERVNAGALKYVGWSAGSNIAGPTICTTNDMPIVEPLSFSALNLLPFQLNPHFTDATPPGHNGETRRQRLAEYLVANPSMSVVCLPEGSGLAIAGATATLIGEYDALLMHHMQTPATLSVGSQLAC